MPSPRPSVTHRTALPVGYFLVAITAVLGDDEYTFAEVWRSGGSWITKVGGRFGTAENPGVALQGAFAVGDYALCRQAEGEGGQVWELLALPATSGTSGCTGCSWLAGLQQPECLEVLVSGVSQYVYLTSDDRLTWASSDTITICGLTYTVSVATNAGGAPQMTLTGVGSGAGGPYTGLFACCACKLVKWALPLDVLCPDDADPGDPCLNVVEVSARWLDCCPITGWQGPGWYCVRAAGSSAECYALELLDADKCDTSIEICSGAYSDEPTALGHCEKLLVGGASCSASVAVALDQWYQSSIAPFGATQSYCLPVTAETTYRLLAWQNSGGSPLGNITIKSYDGACAGSLLQTDTLSEGAWNAGTGEGSPACLEFTPPVGTTHVCITASNGNASFTKTYGFRVEEGTCPP